MLPSVGAASAKDGVNGGGSVIDSAGRIKTAHQTFSPLKHFTEMQKTRRMHTVLPCEMHIVMYDDNAHR
jgi:hypothetical protein